MTDIDCIHYRAVPVAVVAMAIASRVFARGRFLP
jgi:hypothetical protein